MESGHLIWNLTKKRTKKSVWFQIHQRNLTMIKWQFWLNSDFHKICLIFDGFWPIFNWICLFSSKIWKKLSYCWLKCEFKNQNVKIHWNWSKSIKSQLNWSFLFDIYQLWWIWSIWIKFKPFGIQFLYFQLRPDIFLINFLATIQNLMMNSYWKSN